MNSSQLVLSSKSSLWSTITSCTFGLNFCSITFFRSSLLYLKIVLLCSWKIDCNLFWRSSWESAPKFNICAIPFIESAHLSSISCLTTTNSSCTSGIRIWNLSRKSGKASRIYSVTNSFHFSLNSDGNENWLEVLLLFFAFTVFSSCNFLIYCSSFLQWVVTLNKSFSSVLHLSLSPSNSTLIMSAVISPKLGRGIS